MTFIETDGAADQPNHARAFALRPDVLAAWQGLLGAIRADMDPRRYELITMAAARRLRSSYCMLAHGGVLTDLGMSEDQLQALAKNHHDAGLSQAEVALMDLAEKIVDDATAVSAEDIEALRELGLTDAEILDAVLTATARCFFSKTLDALGVQADARFAAVAPALRDVLTVGRPIQSA